MMNAKFVVVLLAEDCAGLDLSAQDDFFEIVPVGEEGINFNPRGGGGSLAGRLCIGLATWDASKATRLELVRNQLAAASQPFLPEIVVLDGERSPDALFFVASQGLTWLARHQAHLIAQMSRDLGVLRRQHEDMQQHFMAIEYFVAGSRIQKYEEAFVNEPDGDVFLEPPPPSDESIGLRQLLPTSSINFCAFALHVAEAAPADGAVVSLSVTTPEDGQTIARWSVPKSRLRRGWNWFGLPRSPGGLARSLVLGVDSTSLPALSLGSVLPLPAYQLAEAATSEQIADRALALRVMVALPGVKVVHDRGTFLPADLPPGEALLQPDPGERPISQDILNRVRMVGLDGAETWPEASVQVEADATILCRPGLGGPTVALLPDSCPGGARKFSCNVLVDSHKSEAVEFRIGWLAEGRVMSPDLIYAESAFAEPDRLCSDWLRVGPQQEMRIEARANAELSSGGSIFLVTRMADDDARPDHALAKFRRFSIAAGLSA